MCEYERSRGKRTKTLPFAGSFFSAAVPNEIVRKKIQIRENVMKIE